MKTITFYKTLASKEWASGALLMGCAVLSLVMANMPIGQSYQALWGRSVVGHPLSHWIDDGLMAVFFLLVGLELKHEVMFGSLNSFRQTLPAIMAAVGGMVVPVLVYLCFNWGSATQAGFGIPMATDIAFVLSVVAILGRRVPPALKVFLMALAVVDDLGAVLVIALFYTAEINQIYLLLAVSLFGLLFVMGRTFGPQKNDEVFFIIFLYLIGGAGMWFLLMRSGVHATISGVLLAVAMPSSGGSDFSPSHRLQQWLHRPVYLLVLPLFILANMAIPFSGVSLSNHTVGASFAAMWQQPQVVGTAMGLLFGKPLGILMGGYVAVFYLKAEVHENLTLRHFIGAALLGGVGFTMAIFITELSFENPYLIDTTKIAVLVSSLLAAVAGALVLSRSA